MFTLYSNLLVIFFSVSFSISFLQADADFAKGVQADADFAKGVHGVGGVVGVVLSSSFSRVAVSDSPARGSSLNQSHISSDSTTIRGNGSSSGSSSGSRRASTGALPKPIVSFNFAIPYQLRTIAILI